MRKLKEKLLEALLGNVQVKRNCATKNQTLFLSLIKPDFKQMVGRIDQNLCNMQMPLLFFLVKS